MHSTSINFNPLSQNQLSSNISNREFSFSNFHHIKRPSNNILVVTAKQRDAYNGKDRRITHGRLVDENMIVLRMRIRDMNLREEKNDEAPSNWMEWEKKWYHKYDSDVYEAIGVLQRFLMDARPSMVVGLLTLLMLSVSTSSAFLLGHLLGFFS